MHIHAHVAAIVNGRSTSIDTHSPRNALTTWPRERRQATLGILGCEHCILRSLEGHEEAVPFGAKLGTAMFCDHDDFESVNDEHGHDAGDAVLVATGRRLQVEVRERDTVARLGGDEFVVLVQGMSDGGLAELPARLAATVAEPIQHLGRLLQVSMSVGLACLAGNRPSVEALLRRADEEILRAKQGRRRR